MFEDVTWINRKLDEIVKAEDPKKALADWFNGLNSKQQKSVFAFAGWLDTAGFVGHYMRTDGTDTVFNSLAESLYV